MHESSLKEHYYLLFLYHHYFRYAYSEAAYITATPTGTIGPITVNEFNTKKIFKNWFLLGYA
jgi:hypothetical protein